MSCASGRTPCAWLNMAAFPHSCAGALACLQPSAPRAARAVLQRLWSPLLRLVLLLPCCRSRSEEPADEPPRPPSSKPSFERPPCCEEPPDCDCCPLLRSRPAPPGVRCAPPC